MLSTFRSAALATILIQAAAPAAVEASDPAVWSKTIAPFVDERTVVIVHVDASRVGVGPTFKSLGKLLPDMRAEFDKSQSDAEDALDQFLKAGGREAFVVVSLADVPESTPFLVVPLADGADEQTLTAMLRVLPFESHRKLQGALVLGAEATLDRLASQRPLARPEVARAFEAAGDTAAQVLVVPTPDSRRVIEELLPTLPAEVGGGPTRTLTRGARWIALGVNATPQLSVSLVLQSQDREAASALRQRWIELYKLVGQRREVLASLPQFELIAAKVVPQLKGDQLVVTLDERKQGVDVLRAMVEPFVRAARAASQRAQSVNNLKQFALAMHVFHDAHKHFPAAASSGADGKSYLSWRVLLLPYLEQEPLYREFHLNEPWDSEHNRPLVERMPDVFRSPLSNLKAPGRTTYVAPIAEGTIFHGRAGTALNEITDGTSNTILIVEADDDRAVVWTKPDDLTLDLDQPQAGLGRLLGDRFLAAFADGSVQTLTADMDPEQLRRLFLRADGKPVDWDKLRPR